MKWFAILPSGNAKHLANHGCPDAYIALSPPSLAPYVLRHFPLFLVKNVSDQFISLAVPSVFTYCGAACWRHSGVRYPSRLQNMYADLAKGSVLDK